MHAQDIPIQHKDLTRAQAQVIAAISGGATMKAASAAASIHRNTILYWRQSSLLFREVLSHAQYDKAIFIREEAETHVTDAFAAIHTILTKPDVSDRARLNAAKYIIDKASTPPLPKPEVICDFETASSNLQVDGQNQENVHSNAQSAKPQPVRPKIGRNDLCPCGSHLKFKRCCLEKANLPVAA